MLSYKNVLEREKRRAEMDRANWEALREQILKLERLPLSKENQRVVSDREYEMLLASGITSTPERFISESARRFQARQKRKEECRARIAEIKARKT